MLNVVMLSFVMLNIVMLSYVVLNVVMLGVVATGFEPVNLVLPVSCCSNCATVVVDGQNNR
jgi:hypothetical protein